MTYAELCAEVSGLLEIEAQDYDRMNVGKSVNRAIKHMINRLPAAYVPQCIKSVVLDLELIGCQEVPVDFVRRLNVRVLYSGTIPSSGLGIPCEWIPQDQWPPTGLNHMPTTANPVYTHVSDFYGIPSTGGVGLIAVLPLPSPAKVTDGFWLQYLGFGDAVDVSHPVPFGPHLWPALIQKTCEYVCLVENYDPARAAIFAADFEKEIEGIIVVGK